MLRVLPSLAKRDVHEQRHAGPFIKLIENRFALVLFEMLNHVSRNDEVVPGQLRRQIANVSDTKGIVQGPLVSL